MTYQRNSATRHSRRPKGRRRQPFEQTVPMVVGRRTVVQEVPESPALAVGLLAVAALSMMAMWIGTSPRFVVADARVVGVERLAAEAVVEASGLTAQHILGVDGAAVEARILEQLPLVEQVQVACHVPANCTITVVERQPQLTWDTTQGMVWVDRSGVVLPAGGPLEGGWLVSGALPVDEEGLVDREVLVGLEELTRAGLEPGRIGYQPGRGLVLDDPSGWRVIVGQGQGMARRLAVYDALRAYLLENDIQPRFVDVRFPEGAYFSEENEW